MTCVENVYVELTRYSETHEGLGSYWAIFVVADHLSSE